MKINLLSYEPKGGWILYDYAARLKKALEVHLNTVSITHDQSPGWDITLHINYAGLRSVKSPGLHCSMVTHIDTPEKFALVKAQAAAGVWGMCMSEDTARRLRALTGIDRFLGFAPPALQEPLEQKKVTVMLAGRLYKDGRKNEQWALKFFKAFNSDELQIRTMGDGWGAYMQELRDIGYSVDYSNEFDQKVYRDWLCTSDYLLVTGHDEGALSTLDALVFGAVPICTAQGYHLEQKGKTLLFQTLSDLIRLANQIRAELIQKRSEIRELSDWNGFALRHIHFWKNLLINQT